MTLTTAATLIVVNLALGFAAGYFYGKHRAKQGFQNLIINTLNERENEHQP